MTRRPVRFRFPDYFRGGLPCPAFIAEYPFEMVELPCDSCNRRGLLRKARLIEQHGADCGVARMRESSFTSRLFGWGNSGGFVVARRGFLCFHSKVEPVLSHLQHASAVETKRHPFGNL
jgi:hypothetical protein